MRSKRLQKYINTRDSDLLGALLTLDNKQRRNSFIANLISDLSHCEAEVLSLSVTNRNAKKYAEDVINDGNMAYVEYRSKQKSPS